MEIVIDLDAVDLGDLEYLKKRLYDRLKQGCQGCFRLGYRSNKGLMLQKHITNVEDDGESSLTAEPSELSTITDRTNSVRSDVFYLCDGQWRSNDWNALSASTVTRRTNSMTVVRRRRVNVPSVSTIEDDFEASVSAVSEFSIIQSYLPWFLPWILTVLIFLVAQNPTAKQLRKRRKERNLKIVRSQEYRLRSRQRTIGMRPIMPSTVSNMLLARSFAKQTVKSTADAPGETKLVDRQCAAVARMNTMSTIGLPCPRLITTPPSSPRTPSPIHNNESSAISLKEGVSLEEASSPTEENTTEIDHQPFKIICQNSEKILIEVETRGLLSEHFSGLGASMDSSNSVEMKDASVCEMTEDNRMTNVANCVGRSMEQGTSEDFGRSPQNLSKSSGNRRAETIKMLKAKKAKEWEMARSRESSGTLDATQSSLGSIGRIESETKSKGVVGVEPKSSSVGRSSMSQDLEVGEAMSRNSSSARPRLDSEISVCTDTSSSTTSCYVQPSHQTMAIMRRASQMLSNDIVGSFSSSVSRCSSISEEDEEEILSAVRISRDSDTRQHKSEEERDAQMAKLQEMFNPEMKPCPPRQTISPFSAVNHEFSPPKPQRPLVSNSPTPPTEPAFEESVTAARSPPKPKRTPPPSPPVRPKEQKRTERAKNTPPPPSKTRSGGKTATPPPPPPPRRGRGGKNGRGIMRSSKVIEMFQFVNGSKKRGSHRRTKTHKEASAKEGMTSKGSGGLIEELEHKSKHIARIQSDVETYGAAINSMIRDIHSRKFESMSELNGFVRRIDDVLEKFEDETAVLKHFEWPQKYYTYREALALWSEFKGRTERCRTWQQGPRGISAELHKMKKTMELNIRRMDDVQRTLEAEVKKFIRNGIPWDSSVIEKVHDGTMCLLEKYMQIVYDEVSRTQTNPTQRNKNLQYLTDTINLTFKIHQCVGGLTESCTTLFEKIAAFTHTFNTDR